MFVIKNVQNMQESSWKFTNNKGNIKCKPKRKADTHAFCLALHSSEMLNNAMLKKLQLYIKEVKKASKLGILRLKIKSK